jgi:hypothetical protein
MIDKKYLCEIPTLSTSEKGGPEKMLARHGNNEIQSKPDIKKSSNMITRKK